MKLRKMYLPLCLVFWLTTQGIVLSVIIWQWVLFEMKHSVEMAMGFWLGSLVISLVFPLWVKPIIDYLLKETEKELE